MWSGHNHLLLSLLPFEKRENGCELDANLFRVVPECHDMGGLAYPYHGAFGWEAYLSR
jgi:hypothetical protein